MIMPSKQISLYRTGSTFFRVTWGEATIHGITIPEHHEDFSTVKAAEIAAVMHMPYPGDITEVSANSLFPHLPPV